MVAWGGKGAAISNNPLAIAVPAGRHPPLVLDTAFSKGAGGKVRLAAKKGERIPADWIVDAAGEPSEDPNDLPNGGALLPLGHKGYSMAVIGEALAGILPDGAILDEIPMWFQFPTERTRVNHLMIAIQIEAFTDAAGFRARVDTMIDRLTSKGPAEGVKEVLVPGELEHRVAERRRREGVKLPAKVVADLHTLRREFGLPSSLDL